MKKDEFIGELRSTIFDPPENDCGYYGVVIKPNWMPTVLTYLLRGFIPIRLGWLNRGHSGDRWFVYDSPNGDSFYDDGERVQAIKVEPLLWCSRKTHYKVKVTFHGGSMWNSTSEPTNEFRISK